MPRTATPKPSLDDAIGDFRAIASGARIPAAKPKTVRKARTKSKHPWKIADRYAEMRKHSTPEERSAVETYNAMRYMTNMGETDMLMYQQAVGIIVARNKRFGLIS